MNRRQKIIVSVTGIFLVLLLLVGLTYAYFLTKINGNENTKSISVTTANLALVYGDDGSVIGEGEKITPGTTFESKTFTVTNTGDDSSYVVVLENTSVTYASTVEVNGETHTAGSATTFESNDFRYTLTCTKKDGSSCNGITYDTLILKDGILVGNDIVSGDVHTYSLTIEYLETGKDQSNDMNKLYNAKINIKDIKDTNPYKSNTSSLAYTIINNAATTTTGTQLVATPPSNVKTDYALENWEGATSINYIYGSFSDTEVENQYYFYNNNSPYKTCANYEEVEDLSSVDCIKSTVCRDDLIGSYIYGEGALYYEVVDCIDGRPVIGKGKSESVMSAAQDDYGTSYYYRGGVADNYVSFAGMLWRIVRIQGDGSIKLLLDSVLSGNRGIWGTSSKTVGSNTYEVLDYLNSVGGMAKSFYDFQRTIAKGMDSAITDTSTQSEISTVLSTKLKSGDWCMNDKAYDSATSNVYTDNPLTDKEIEERYSLGGAFYYDPYVRLNGSEKEPTLKCNGTVMKSFNTVGTSMTATPMYVGAITADEVIYGGVNQNLKINNNASNIISTSYLLGDDYYYTLSPSLPLTISSAVDYGIPDVYSVSDNSPSSSVVGESGKLFSHMAVAGYPSYRPMIILKNGVNIASGNGTKTNPYVIQ